MDVDLALLCDYANITNDGKVNILGVFGAINPPVLPFALPQAFVVITFGANAAEQGTSKHVRIELVGEDGGAPLITLDQDVTLPSPPIPGMRITLNLMIGLAGLVFPSSGSYALNILVNAEWRQAIPLRVNQPVNLPGGGPTALPPGGS